VSDIPQGPGWWRATDGRWYPPHLHPENQPPAGPDGVPGPAPGWWLADDGRWYPPHLHPGYQPTAGAAGTWGAAAPLPGAATQSGTGSPKPRRARKRNVVALCAIGLVVAVVLALVAVSFTSSSPNGPSARPDHVTAQTLNGVTKIPASVYNEIGVTAGGSRQPAGSVIAGQKTIVFDHKPGILYVGGEFCPYCAAQRWAIIASLSRFGTFSGLGTMQSSSTDVYPATQTFTFAHATYSSPYFVFVAREIYSNVANSDGAGYERLNHLDPYEQSILAKYDQAPYTGGSPTTGGSIPFIDFDNRVIFSGSSFTPAVLQGESRREIANDLHNPSSASTRAIIVASNSLSAAVCSIDGDRPASVCDSVGVAAAKKALAQQTPVPAQSSAARTSSAHSFGDVARASAVVGKSRREGALALVARHVL